MKKDDGKTYVYHKDSDEGMYEVYKRFFIPRDFYKGFTSYGGSTKVSVKPLDLC